LAGDLTIAGTTKAIVLIATAQVQGNKLMLSGKYKLNMTHYGVEAPKALMGTIKTGEEVTVNFKVMYQ
jgi:polyisoprenoid-binding protein YceI